jgi:hypothetical protein
LARSKDKPALTAKVRVERTVATGSGSAVYLTADYADGRNKEWADATPSMNVSATVKNSVAEHFPAGQRFTLTFTPVDEDDEEITDGEVDAR